MSQFEKYLNKLLNKDTVLTFLELEYILSKLGYSEKKSGKTSGSRKVYINKKNNHIIFLHRPHPGNEIKKYVKEYIIDELKKMGLL